MSQMFDVVVVGSGPSGALAAWKLVNHGLRVLMLDVANDDDRYRYLVPDLPFSEIRKTDQNQRRYFLGDQLEGIPQNDVRVGAQLTPPRLFTIRDTQELLPVSGADFEPMQSLALGGLGAAWGAAVFTYSETELRKIGIFEKEFGRHYNEVAKQIGVSADTSDYATREYFTGVKDHLPALEIDSLAKNLLDRYSAKQEALLQKGFALGKTPLAILSRDYGDRKANPYFDMDFWSEARKSVFRPRYLIDDLQQQPNFRLEAGNLVISFKSEEGRGVTVHCWNPALGVFTDFRVRRLLLCAGAINSARIAMNSLGIVDRPVPILCNPYVYLPSLNLAMLGRPASDRRHSMSQLSAIYRPEDAPGEMVSVQFYGYRSLLLFKLVKEIALPPWAGLLLVRLLVNSIVIVGVHHPDSPRSEKNMRILSSERTRLPEVRFEYTASGEEQRLRIRREKKLTRLFHRLGLFPFRRISPGSAASIHYAGTLPIDDGIRDGTGTRPNGQLLGASSVYVGDSSSWRYLPAKGLTFTLMANALRVAEHVIRDLGSE